MAGIVPSSFPHSSSRQRSVYDRKQSINFVNRASGTFSVRSSSQYRRFQFRSAAALGSKENGVESAPATDIGHGGNNGNVGNNGGGGGGDGNGGGGTGPKGVSLWSLLAVAAASVTVFKVYRESANGHGSGDWWNPLRKASLKSKQTSGGDSDVTILRRLVKEAFADLVKVRSRLDELEDVTGISEDALLADDKESSRLGAGVVARGGSRGTHWGGSGGQGSRAGRTTLGALSGSLEMGGGLLWSPDDGASGEVLPSTGVKLGTDLSLKMRGRPRGGRDMVQAECLVSPSSEQLSLKKVLYYLRLAPALRLALAPLGATAQDAAYTLNPLSGQGLSGMVRHGSPVHQRPLGSLLGAALDSERAWASAACSVQAAGQDSPSVHTSLLAQAILAVAPTLSLGLAALQQQATSDADVAPAASHTPRNALAAITPRGVGVTITPRASVGGGGSGITPRSGGGGGGSMGMGVLPSPRTGTPRGGAAGSPAPAPWEGVAPVAGAAPLRQLSAMFAWRPDPDLVIHGWASADGDATVRSVQSRGIQGIQPEQWGISLGSYPDSTGNGWAVALGRSAAVAAAGGSAAAGGGNGKEATAAPNLFELSLQLSLGEGVVVTPGLLCAVHDRRSTFFAGLKTTWDW